MVGIRQFGVFSRNQVPTEPFFPHLLHLLLEKLHIWNKMNSNAFTKKLKLWIENWKLEFLLHLCARLSSFLLVMFSYAHLFVSLLLIPSFLSSDWSKTKPVLDHHLMTLLKIKEILEIWTCHSRFHRKYTMQTLGCLKKEL